MAGNLSQQRRKVSSWRTPRKRRRKGRKGRLQLKVDAIFGNKVKKRAALIFKWTWGFDKLKAERERGISIDIRSSPSSSPLLLPSTELIANLPRTASLVKRFQSYDLEDKVEFEEGVLMRARIFFAATGELGTGYSGFLLLLQ